MPVITSMEELQKAKNTFKEELKDSPSKEHTFKNKWIMGCWQWTDEAWYLLTADGLLQKNTFHYGKMKSVNNIEITVIIIGGFKLSFGFLKN